MSHFTNITTGALSAKGHGFEFGGKHGSIERQGDVGWGVQTKDPRGRSFKESLSRALDEHTPTLEKLAKS